MYQERIARVRAHMKQEESTQLLICEPTSIKYLTGYFTEPIERFLALLVTPNTTTLFVNALFPTPAEGAADVIVTLTDTDDVPALLLNHLNLDEALAVDKNLEARWLVPLLKGGIDAHSLRLGSSFVDDARAIKDASEQELMRAASATNDRAMEWLKAQLHVGVTEEEIAQGLLDEYKRLGAEGFSFDPIVSFGINNADPHHEPDGTRLKAGDVVLFDVGCKQNDYCSDMTRCFFFGEPDPETLKIYETVRAANERAESIIKPGVTFAEIDAAARDLITEAGYGSAFTHRLGHQIGLSVHEPGDVSATHDEKVKPGHIFSIEPGIYVEGLTGVRIEDLVLVTEDGVEILNHFSKEPEVLEVK